MSLSKSELFHSQDYKTLTVENEAATETVVAGLEGLTITPTTTTDQKYTADSSKIEDQISYEHAVNVEIETAYWDGDFAQEWLGGSGSSSSSWTDGSDPELFQISTYTHDSRDDSIEITAEVDNITFEEIPLVEWSQGEYLSWNLSGTGEDIPNYTVEAPV
jgi:hypothetical protein